MIPILASVLALLGQASAEPDLTALIPLAADLFTAIMAGGWWKAAAVVVTALTLALRWVPWAPIRTIPGQVGGAFLLAALGGLLNALAAGASITVDVVTTALQIGGAAGAAAGGLTAIIAWWKNRGSGPGGTAVAVIALALLLPAGALAVQLYGSGAAVTCPASGAAAVALEDTTKFSVNNSRYVTVCVPEVASNGIAVGGKGVTSATGLQIGPGKCFGSLILTGTEGLYCVSQTATTIPVRVLAGLP